MGIAANGGGDFAGAIFRRTGGRVAIGAGTGRALRALAGRILAAALFAWNIFPALAVYTDFVVSAVTGGVCLATGFVIFKGVTDII